MIAIGVDRVRGIVHWIGGVWRNAGSSTGDTTLTTSDYDPIFMFEKREGTGSDTTTILTDNRTGAQYEAVEVTTNLPPKGEEPKRPMIVSELAVRRDRPKRIRPRHQRQARAPAHVPQKWLVRKHTR